MRAVSILPTGMSHRTRLLQGCEEEVISVHGISNVIPFLALEDLELDDGWQVHWPAVGRRFCALATCSGSHGLLQDLHLVGEGTAIVGRSRGRALGLVVDGEQSVVVHDETGRRQREIAAR